MTTELTTREAIGTLRRGYDIGYKQNRFYIWAACQSCGKERWTQVVGGKPRNKFCASCHSFFALAPYVCLVGKDHPHWKGGRTKTNDGYALITLNKNDLFYPMATKKGTVREHRLVMARYLNRCLLPWEVVHHKNGVKDDNRLDNLELISSNGRHNTQVNKYILKLQGEIMILKTRIIELEGINDRRN